MLFQARKGIKVSWKKARLKKGCLRIVMAELLYKNVFGRIMKNDFSRKRIDSSICFLITNHLQIVNMHVHLRMNKKHFLAICQRKLNIPTYLGNHALQHLRNLVHGIL